MRNPVLVIVLLVLLALVPIGAWLAMAASLDPAGLGRGIGKAILIVLSPSALAGLLMIVGAAIFKSTRRAGRIVGTVGASIAGIVGLIAAVFWVESAGRCVEGGHFCTDRLVEGSALLLYAIVHFGLIVLIWRARRGELSSAI